MTTLKKPYAILCADIHLREDQPACRTDDFQAAQWKKMEFIKSMANKYDCRIIHSGDMFHHWKPSPALLSKTIKHLPDNPAHFLTVYGNHDLPQHNIELANKSGVHTLETAGKLEVLSKYSSIKGCHWLQTPALLAFCDILVWHVMTFQKGEEPYPGCTDASATKLLKKYPQPKLIVTGDNHKTFTAKVDDRILINPGSMTRQTANQIDHEPCVFFYYKEDNTFEKVYLPFDTGVVSRQHLEIKEEHDKRLEAFISSLSDCDIKEELSFKDRILRYCKENNTDKNIVDIIINSINK